MRRISQKWKIAIETPNKERWDGVEKPGADLYYRLATIGHIAANPSAGTMMSLASNAWGVFGAAFGPLNLLSLFRRRFTFQGAMAGVTVGAIAEILWLVFVSATGVLGIICQSP